MPRKGWSQYVVSSLGSTSPPHQRVPASRQRREPLFSIPPRSSLPWEASTIEKFIGTADTP